MLSKTEILAPAGNMDAVRAAVNGHADAVYLGGSLFSARAFAGNFDEKELLETIDYCHTFDVKVYMAVNTLLKNDEIKRLPDYLEPYYREGVDGIIVQDMGVAGAISGCFPDLPLHGSTQLSVSSEYGAAFLKSIGMTRFVPSRELSLDEIRSIKSKIDIEVETFVHGAMCYCYSGRCLMSSYAGGRSGNRGRCAQPCRKRYQLEDQRAYMLSLKDMCMLSDIGRLIDAGIDSFKIEGRMKTALYVATVARTYRKAIDDYFESEEKYRSNMEYYKSEIAKCTYRQFTTGFYFGKTDSDSQIYDSNTYVKNYTYIGTVRQVTDDGCVCFEQKNKFSVGECVEAMDFNGDNIECTVEAIYDEDGALMESAPHPKQQLKVKFSEQLTEGMIIRRKE